MRAVVLEGVGVVEAMGDMAGNLWVGDRVVIPSRSPAGLDEVELTPQRSH